MCNHHTSGILQFYRGPFVWIIKRRLEDFPVMDRANKAVDNGLRFASYQLTQCTMSRRQDSHKDIFEIHHLVPFVHLRLLLSKLLLLTCITNQWVIENHD